MQKQFNQLIEWHTRFNVPFATKPTDMFLDKKTVLLRYRVMKEEIEEWKQAAEYFSVVQRAKELADILYTVLGTIITEGLQEQFEKIFDAVHESNMSKLDKNGNPVVRADGKILKGENYHEPDLDFLINITEVVIPSPQK